MFVSMRARRRPPAVPDPPLLPARRPPWHRGRPRKCWRWLGVFGPELAVCAGRVEIAGLPQRFWAVWEPGHPPLREHTALGAPPRRQRLDPDRLRVRERGVEIALALRPAGEAVAVLSPHGRSWIWTRKRPVRAVGSVRRDGRVVHVDAPGLVDDSVGYHARATDWRWAAGAGTDDRGRAVVWNLVEGVHDAASGSERRVWVDGRAHEVGAVAFGEGLDGVGFAAGERLTFTAQAVRERHERLLGGLISSDYVQPFGRAAGELPGGVRLLDGVGVMEQHRARW